MKYLLALLFLTIPVQAEDPPPAVVINKIDYSQGIILETTKGEVFTWPKNLIPTITTYSVSANGQFHAVHRFFVRGKDGIIDVTVTHESYLRYKRIMGIK
jgi:hypothetical protein